jgi:hypothetical protein
MENETIEPQELQQQLKVAAEELRSVRADYEQQFQQVREAAEGAKEYKSWNRSWRKRLKRERE